MALHANDLDWQGQVAIVRSAAEALCVIGVE